MIAGKMKNRITFKDVIAGQNYSGNTGVMSNIISVWASIEELNMGRALYYGIVENKKSYKINTRYIESIEDRKGAVISFEGKNLNIHSIIENKGDNELTIIAYE